MDKNVNKYAVINNGRLVNIVMADDDFALDQGWVKCENEWQIGNKLELIDDNWQIVTDKKANIIKELSLLDTVITPRTLRQAALGDETAINIIKEVEEKAEELRQKLAELEVENDQ